MSRNRYSEEFKKEAVKQITEGGCTVADVVSRLGTTLTAFICSARSTKQGRHRLS